MAFRDWLLGGLVAGIAMVRWAGGTVTDLDGDPWGHDDRGLVASNGQNHELLVETAVDIDRAKTA